MHLHRFMLHAVTLLCAAFFFGPLVAAGADRPNIVWILSEDNSLHYLDHYFPGGAKTPAICFQPALPTFPR